MKQSLESSSFLNRKKMTDNSSNSNSFLKTSLRLGKYFFFFFLIASFIQLNAQNQVGDAGVTFDQSKFDPDYPQMQEWTTAGVRGGIPLIENVAIKKTITATNAAGINSAINSISNGAVLLKNGTYNINASINMKSGVSLIGESRNGVKCIIATSMTANAGAFEFMTGDQNCGIYRLTIEGGWGTPSQDWNIGSSSANNELPGNENISVFFKDAIDCWIDDCDIINSADFPVRIVSDHITVRNCHIDGVHNKHGGAHGYFFVLEGYNLITGCYITHLRHISLQGGGVRYNVVYDNDFDQEVSFHSGDDGDNLIENNRIHLPADMPNGSPDYYAIMGPWSTQHEISVRPNYIYKNDVIEYNHNGATPWSDPNIVYYGPHVVKPIGATAIYNNFTAYSKGEPQGGTLYPVVLGTPPDPTPVTGVSVSPTSASVETGSTITLSANVSPANATNKSVNWSSSNNAIATVSNGVVSGISAGSVTITATTVDGGFNASASVNVSQSNNTTFNLNAVQDAYLQGSTAYNSNILRVESGNRTSYLMFDLSSVSGSISEAELKLSVAGDAGNGQITIAKGNNNNWTEANLSTSNAPTSSGQVGSLNTSYADGNTYTWVLDASSISAGSQLSLIVTHISGNDVSFASDENSNSSLRPVLTVKTANDVTAVTGVSVAPTSISLEEGQTATLTETVSPGDASDKTVSWSSNNTNIATVNQSGVVTAVSEGTASITVTTNDGAFAANCTVSVTSIPSGQTPYGGSARSIPGTIEAEHYDEGGQNVAYYDNTSGNNGGAVRTDDVDIEARDGGYNVGWSTDGEWLEYTINSTAGTYDIEVRVAAVSTGKKINISLDGSAIGTFDVPNTGAWGTFQTISLNGIALTGGSGKILRLTFEGGSVNLNWIKFTQVNLPTPVSGITVSPGTLSLEVGETATLSETVTPSDADDKSVSWASNNTSVATVNQNGVVSAQNAGNATITVTTNDGGYTASCTVAVSDPQPAITYTETINNMNLDGWGTETYTGDNGFVWNVDAKGVSGYINSSKGIYFNAGKTGITSNTIPGGISSFSVKCLDKWSTGTTRTVQLLVNGNVVGSRTHTGTEQYNFLVENINISGDVTIAIKNATSGSGNTIAIDDITWTSYGAKSADDTESLSINQNAEIHLYPNPLSGDILTLEVPENEKTFIQIFSIEGKAVFSNNFFEQKKIELCTSELNLHKGVYFISVRFDQKTKVSKLIVQ